MMAHLVPRRTLVGLLLLVVSSPLGMLYWITGIKALFQHYWPDTAIWDIGLPLWGPAVILGFLAWGWLGFWWDRPGRRHMTYLQQTLEALDHYREGLPNTDRRRGRLHADCNELRNWITYNVWQDRSWRFLPGLPGAKYHGQRLQEAVEKAEALRKLYPHADDGTVPPRASHSSDLIFPQTMGLLLIVLFTAGGFGHTRLDPFQQSCRQLARSANATYLRDYDSRFVTEADQTSPLYTLDIESRLQELATVPASTSLCFLRDRKTKRLLTQTVPDGPQALQLTRVAVPALEQVGFIALDWAFLAHNVACRIPADSKAEDLDLSYILIPSYRIQTYTGGPQTHSLQYPSFTEMQERCMKSYGWPPNTS